VRWRTNSVDGSHRPEMRESAVDGSAEQFSRAVFTMLQDARPHWVSKQRINAPGEYPNRKTG
jgi:hypothetical protein